MLSHGINNRPGTLNLVLVTERIRRAMTIQIKLDIDSDIERRLIDGTATRVGGRVIDTSTKRIIKFLKEIEDSDGPSTTESHSPDNGFPTKVLLGLVVAIPAVIIGAASYLGRRKQTSFDIALREYLTLAKSGNLSAEAVEKLKSHLNESQNVSISADQLNDLLGYVNKYTRQLAAANNYHLPSDLGVNDDFVSKLDYYLGVQQEIFAKAA